MPRLGDPLDVARRPDHLIVGNRITTCIMEIVGPLINVLGTWLDIHTPRVSVLHVCHASGDEHAHHLTHRDLPEFVCNQQVDEVITVRQAQPIPAFNRDGTIQIGGLNEFARLLNISGIIVQSVDPVHLALTQGRRQPSIPTANVNDQTTFYVTCF